MDNKQLIEELKKLLANTFSLYLKAHNYHWNVTGPNFAQYHEFFAEFYSEVYGSVDSTAEEIRKQGGFAPGALGRFSELTEIQDELTVPEPAIMFARLARDNAVLLKNLYIAREAAEKIGAFGSVNYLEGRIDIHEKHAWMLKSF